MTSTMPVSVSEDAAIGPYRVVRKLGQGGMGVVFEALHTGLGRRVAIKVLRAELAADKEVASRFAHEARTVNRVEHPGVVQVVDLGEQPGGQPYIVMEFLRGQTLAERLKERGGSLSWEELVGLLVQVAEVLVVAHRADVVHRGHFRKQIPSRNRDLMRTLKAPGKPGKIRGLRLVLDGSQQSRAFTGAHRA